MFTAVSTRKIGLATDSPVTCLESVALLHDSHPALPCTAPLSSKCVHVSSTGHARRSAAASADLLPFWAGSNPAAKNADCLLSAALPMGVISMSWSAEWPEHCEEILRDYIL